MSSIFFLHSKAPKGNSRHSDKNIRGTCTTVCHRQKLGGPVSKLSVSLCNEVPSPHSGLRKNSCATWAFNKVHEFIAVKVLHNSLLNTIVVAFKLLPLGSYAPMPAPSPPFKTILELVLWNGLQSCLCINPEIIKVIKMPSFKYFLYLGEQKKVTVG